jgi:thiol-disulfide isomerase/thioredoxin
VLALLVVASAVLAVVLRRRDGRVCTAPDAGRIGADELGVSLGPAATFVQFSSPMCAPCRAVRRVLGELAAARPDVVHVDLDAARRLDLVRRHSVLTTPTVLVLDASGAVRQRLIGAAARPTVLQALMAVAPDAAEGSVCGPGPSIPVEASRA